MRDLKLLSLWAVNGELDYERLKAQLIKMRECGLQGTVFHPRYYPGSPAYMSVEYLAILSQVILCARDLGLEFWIYDENGWPSGSADGQVLKRFPESRCEWMYYKDGIVSVGGRPGFNAFDREEMEFFVRFTYDGYRLGLNEEAFSYVTGFFSDEVGFLDGHGVSMSMGAVPWHPEAERIYGDRTGHSLRQDWHKLFMEEGNFGEVRSGYWQILSDILSESFYKTVAAWCSRYGKRHTAHLKGEENLFFQTACSGSAYQNLKQVNTPAVDALERYPGNHYYPRIASSLSRQFSDGRCLAEALGGSGWGLTPEDLERYVDWLAGCGIDTIAFHLWQYRKDSASVRDWPPDIIQGLNWRDAAGNLFKRLHEKWDGRIGSDNPILVVAPERGVMASFCPQDAMAINEHNGAGVPDRAGGGISRMFEEFAEHCHHQQLAFDVCSERILEEHAVLENGELRIGHARYSSVICGKGAVFSSEEVTGAVKRAGLWYDMREWQWTYTGHGGNRLPLHAGENTVAYRCDGPLKVQVLERSVTGCGWHIRSLDCLDAVYAAAFPEALEERLIPVRDVMGHYIYPLSEELIKKVCSGTGISVRICTQGDGENEPFVFLEGGFLVRSTAGYRNKDSRQQITAGDFFLTSDGGELHPVHDLIASGFPFCATWVELESMVHADPSGTVRLDRERLHADCILMQLDNRKWDREGETLCCWGPDWKAQGVQPGVHRARIRLIPSTFNLYGPHHYMDGDRHLTSPMQYSGRKGFADAPEAPEYTLVPEWHLVKFGI